MTEFTNIEKKLHQFTRKYYTSELIKGSILFFTLGFLYLFFILFLEYFLWLKPTARTILFWLFIAVEGFLLFRFIMFPIFKLTGLRKGITLEESSKIIGNHFPEVQDKLLNVLQLKNTTTQSDLLIASINQKSEELQSIPFVKAIDFTQNKKYLKFALIPLLIWLITLFSGNNTIFTESLERVVNHKTSYTPPAPFAFSITNKSLQVVQGKPITIQVEIVGNVLPNEAKVLFDNQQYFIQNNGNGSFSYTFSDVQKPIIFYLEANQIQSQNYQIDVIKTPTINSISLNLNYPRYLNKKNDTIQNSGNIIVPEGTNITWKVKTNQTDSVTFISKNLRTFFNKKQDNEFVYSKRIRKAIHYQISSSNHNLKNFESLQFSVDVVKDEAPQISVQSNIDSISRGTAFFAGQISDDYGLTKLQIVYYDEKNPQDIKTHFLPITRSNIQTFFYEFPKGLQLNEGVNYEFYFEVFDNDAVNGSKKAKSKTFDYRQKTNQEKDQEILQEQRNTINSLENSIQKQKKEEQKLETIQNDIQLKKNVNWNDKKKIDNFIKRQEQYKKMMQRQTDKLQENLDEKKETSKDLQTKKEELKQRIEELKKLEKQKRLLDEIKKIANKLNKEDLVKKAKELAQQNKQQRRSLERMLELTKRFYVEQKTMQIAAKLNELSKKQDSISNLKNTPLQLQENIKKKFNSITKELKQLEKDNEKLKEPMKLADVEDEKKEIHNELENSEKQLKKQDQKNAKKSQKKSANKMQKMSAKMQQSMLDQQGESVEENMDDLRKILENLVIFSFKQENLMNKFSETSTSHPDFGKNLKKQNDIRTYFKHIDDSLYVLSMRLPKISAKIQNDLSSAHYNLDQSLYNFSENRFFNGVSNQRYVMTATNNLADYLSTILNNMKNAKSMKQGKGKGSGFSLPDIIKKQGELSKKMQQGMKKGNKKGQNKNGNKPGNNGKSQGKDSKGNKGNNSNSSKTNSNGFNENQNGELYEIYKKQFELRQQLQNAIKNSKNGKPSSISNAKKALKTMEELENEILEKGFTISTLQKMQRLNYQLLKLDKASLEQGEDSKRKSTSSINNYKRNKVKALQFKKRFYNQIEILNRQSLPLQQNFKIKVRNYFSDTNKE